MPLTSAKPPRWTRFSPWMIIWPVCILAAILLILAVKNINREKQFMMTSLSSEANVLMNSLEASSRTGMMGMGWGQRQVQLLLKETAQQPDILYVRIVTADGRIIADSQQERVHTIASFTPPQAGHLLQRFVDDNGQRSFQVIRAYQPWFGHRGRNSCAMSCGMSPGSAAGSGAGSGAGAGPGSAAGSAAGSGVGSGVGPGVGPGKILTNNRYIMVGLDPAPFETARKQDLQQTMLLFGIMFLVGAAGIVSLFWAQNYQIARSSLQDIQAFTSTIIGQMPVGMITVDRKGWIQKTNEAARDILRSAELKGDISQYPCFVSLAEQLRKEEVVLEEEIKCSLDGGQMVPLLVNASVIRDGEQRTTGYVLLFTDITNIKQLEEQLRRSERLAALGRLAAGIAHEIRNPLSSIKGFANILSGKFAENDPGRNIARVMEQEIERINRVVSELLDFARPTEVHKQRSLAKDLVERTLHLIDGDAAQSHIRIETELEPPSLEIAVDPDRFAQILLNLYLNALQAMEEGGKLTVRVFQQAGQVIFQVSDTGAGISAEHLPHIFDPYFTTKPRGVGLGLANVHKLVEAHGGNIEVQSSPAHGTDFIIYLPGTGHTPVSQRVEAGVPPMAAPDQGRELSY